MIGNWKRLLAVLGLAVASLSAWSGAAFGQGASASGPDIEASMSASLRGNTAVYSISLRNLGSEPLHDVFVAGSVPEGAIFLRALDTPEGSWFRGFEGAGTGLQSAAWLSKSIPANGTVGPFSFVVETGKATYLGSRAFAHFRLPTDGSSVSPAVELPLLPGSPTQSTSILHDVHTKTLGLSCNSCHNASAANYSDPLANIANPVDKNACFGCHSSGSKAFFGDAWDTVRIR